jgi:SAM-dependent methyltransferase
VTPSTPLALHRWDRPVDASDRAVLAHCVGPTLDVGCGPGRMSAHLAEPGRAVRGVDLVHGAVVKARERGAQALHRDIFDPLPGEGRWGTALLADGNIGIGGDPALLLRRMAAVIAGDGRIVTDLAPPGDGVRTGWVHLVSDGVAGTPFRWAWVAVDEIAPLAMHAGLVVTSQHEHDGRWFAVLEKAA